MSTFPCPYPSQLCTPPSTTCLRRSLERPSRFIGHWDRACWNRLTNNVWRRNCLCEKSPFERQKPLPVHYKGTQLDCGYRLDFLVADIIVVDVKAIDALLPIHQAQLLSYLKLGGWKLGLLINFHVPLLREGIKRVVSGLEEPPESVTSKDKS